MTHDGAFVFVVDDDAVRRALTRLIASAQWCVRAYASAQAFLDDDGVRSMPACLVLDVRMPGLNGLDLQDFLGASRDTLPIVFITGHGDVPTPVHAMRAGATDVLAKPIDDAALLKAIDVSLERSSRALAQRAEIETIRQRVDSLTPRELQVLALVVGEWLNKQVASDSARSKRPSRYIARI